MTTPPSKLVETPLSDEDQDRCRECGLEFCSVEHAQRLEAALVKMKEELDCAQENFHVTNQAYVKSDVALAQSQKKVAELRTVLTELVRLYDLRFELARQEGE